MTLKMAKRKAANEESSNGAALAEDSGSDEVSSLLSHCLTALNVVGGL
jgi:hypothetical protein